MTCRPNCSVRRLQFVEGFQCALAKELFALRIWQARQGLARFVKVEMWKIAALEQDLLAVQPLY